ncbi:nucleoside recognition domain-containing protein [Halobacillus yeomjeoni]|uniref:Nucleoside recognition domain-containing protein n=1 Tax=Halobacillus yeomjeoni TaxID=311194 RepID=A0A931HX02_9BACI|nr:nucleoside recognition domain-containing protein [Halobacillus yeomjeoni]MBH0230920.1 nucleoside recognition domain-containing protein [Halobacillus yeomjeoni]
MKGIIKRGAGKGISLTWTLGKVIFPVTLIVTILQYTPVLPWVVEKLEPLMKFIGLSGEAAVPLVVGNFLNLYAGIAAIISFEFTVKEVFILAVMMSFSHNLLIESTVAKKVGVSWWFVAGVRLSLAFLSAVLINLLWKGGGEVAKYGLAPEKTSDPGGWGEIIWQGFQTAFMGVLQLALIVIPLMIFMQYLREKGWLDLFSRWVAPATRFLGMERNTSMTLVAGLTIGLAYGAGLMIQAVEEDGVSKKDMYLAILFLVSCHAVVEDTLIFIPLGIPVWPLLAIRLATAIILTAGVGFVWNRLQQQRKDTSYENKYHTF